MKLLMFLIVSFHSLHCVFEIISMEFARYKFLHYLLFILFIDI